MIEISQDKSLLDVGLIHGFLTETYWAKGRTIDEVKTSIDNCLCYGVYLNKKQVGFARVLTDKVVFAYIMDVFILPEYRGNGYSKLLMEAVLNTKELTSCKWLLKTADAHGLYKQFGFEIDGNPERIMERKATNEHRRTS